MTQQASKHPFLNLIARVSLTIFFIASVALLAVLLLVLVNHEGGYQDFIRSQLITQKNMQLAVLIAGLTLIMVTALSTWLIGLFASFRVAGPLYRFSQNISHLLEHKEILNIRKGDHFQQLSTRLKQGIHTLDIHKQQLARQIKLCKKLLEGGASEENQHQLIRNLQELQEIESRVKLND